MQLLEQITGPNAENLPRLGQDLALTPEESLAVLSAVLPEFAHNVERETLSRGGLAEIVQMLGQERNEAFLDGNADLASPAAIAQATPS